MGLQREHVLYLSSYPTLHARPVKFQGKVEEAPAPKRSTLHFSTIDVQPGYPIYLDTAPFSRRMDGMLRF